MSEETIIHEYDRKQYFIKHFQEKGYGLSHIESLYNDVYDEEEKDEIVKSYLELHPQKAKDVGEAVKDFYYNKFECPKCGKCLGEELKEILNSNEENPVIKCPDCDFEAELNISSD